VITAEHHTDKSGRIPSIVVSIDPADVMAAAGLITASCPSATNRHTDHPLFVPQGDDEG
jgi:hypothetical protein